jgi:hypothetical protein
LPMQRAGEKLQRCRIDESLIHRWPHVERCLTLGITRMTALSRSLSGCYTNEGCTLLRVLERMPVAWKEHHETHFGNLLRSVCVPRKTSPKDPPSVCLSCKINVARRRRKRNHHLYHDPTT